MGPLDVIFYNYLHDIFKVWNARSSLAIKHHLTLHSESALREKLWTGFKTVRYLTAIRTFVKYSRESGIVQPFIDGLNHKMVSTSFFPNSSCQTIANIAFISKESSKYAKYVVAEMNSKDSHYNYVICHGEHSYLFNGRKGKDWGHYHQDFPIANGTVG